MDGSARFAALAAQTAGCDQAKSQLLPLHRAFCNGGWLSRTGSRLFGGSFPEGLKKQDLNWTSILVFFLGAMLRSMNVFCTC